jgi:hypothetical protein
MSRKTMRCLACNRVFKKSHDERVVSENPYHEDCTTYKSRKKKQKK